MRHDTDILTRVFSVEKMTYFNRITNVIVMLDMRTRLQLKLLMQQSSLINFLRTK